MKRFLKKIAMVFVTFFICGCFFSVFLVSTTSGMKTLAYISSIYFHHLVVFERVEGKLLGHSTWGELRFKYKDMTFKFKNMSLQWNPLALWHHELSITALHVETINVLYGDKTYSLSDVSFKALMQPKQININALQFNYLNFNFSTQGTIQRDLPYSTQSTVHIVSNVNPAVNGLVQLQGDFNLLEWHGQTNYLGDIVLEGTLSQLKTLKQTLQWHAVHWPSPTKPQFSSNEGTVTIEGTWPNLLLQCTTQFRQNQQKVWQLHATAKGNMPWSWDFNAKLDPLNNSLKGEGVTSSLILNGSLQDSQNGHITLQASPGIITFIQNDKLSSIPLTKGTLTATLSQKNLSGQAHVVLDTNKIIEMQFGLPQFNLFQSLSSQQSFTSKITATMDSFDFISQWIPEIKNPKGLLHLVLTGHGTIKEPYFETQLEVDNASADIPELGLQLSPIQLHIKSKKNRFKATGLIKSKGQSLIIKGQGALFPNTQASITLEGANIPVVNTHEFQINATPKLLLHYDNNILQISGTLLVPHAVVKILSFSNSISFSRDAVYENKQSVYTPPLGTQMDVLVTMGDDVDLTAKGLHATLTGSVQIKQKPQSAISAIGELNVLRGEYKAYGQNLSIEQGELFFTGGAIDNPGINVRASKKINTETINASSTTQMLDFDSNSLQNANLRGSLTVGVEVTGRLTDPEIQLFSTPAILSQADILSMLILGRPASQANKAGGQLLLAAISSMDLGKGTNGAQLLDQLKRNLGVDFNIETNSNYNLLTNTVSDKSALVVSKSVSKRLSVGYNVGLSQTDPNVITLKYLLSKFFSVQVSTSSSNSGIDVLYTSSKK